MTSSDPPLPAFSVVVPVRDMADTLPALLDSLRRLDYPAGKLQILIVDNGSSDPSGRIARGRGFDVIDLPSPASSYAARNAGCRRATGRWVAFTDADCVVDSGWLRALASRSGEEELGAVAGEVASVGSGTIISRLMERHGFMRHQVTMHHKALAAASTANLAIRRDILERLGGFRDELRHFGDMDLCWRMQIELGAALGYEPAAIVRHGHRRSWGGLWRQAVAHGRGVAWMKQAYPEIYRFSAGEQMGRMGGILRTIASAPLPGTGRPARDRAAEPLFLSLWYAGMTAGFLMGPAFSREDRRQGDTRRPSGEA